MTTDKQTIAVYDSKADEYSKSFSNDEIRPAMSQFIDKLPKGAKVLDLGCGPGAQAAAMHAYGLQVTATDASSAMVELARTNTGIDVYQSEFSDLSDREIYDGIWANFSLLHAPRSAFPNHLERISGALKPKGVLHIGMKTGDGEQRDDLGRNYTFYTVEELCDFLHKAGFMVIKEDTGKSSGLAGTVDPWVVILAQLD